MKEIKTCEEYVLNELAECKAIIDRYEKACKGYTEVLKEVDLFIDLLKKYVKIYKSNDGTEFITMSYLFEDFHPDDFKLLKTVLELKIEETA